MEYQQCRYKNKVKKIPIREINGQFYMFLKDVQDQFPGTRSFTCDGKPISFEHDEHHVRLEPARIRASNEKLIDCHEPTSIARAAAGIGENLNQPILLEIRDGMKKIGEDIEILKAKADAILRQTFEVAEYTVPRLFIVLPEDTPRYNPAHWFHLTYRLHFLCECENVDERHFAFHEGYEIKQPREFFRRYGPYLRKMLTVVKCAISLGSLIVPQLSPIASGISSSVIPKDRISWNNLRIRIERLDEILTEAGKSHNISTTRSVQHVEGAALRGIESFLKKTDDHRTFGNLFRSVTNDGHVRWVCIQHHDSHYSETEIKDLCEKFQKLGGEMKEDVAIIQGKASNNFSEMLKVLREGLPIFSIVLKDLHLKEEDFDILLSYVSQQSVIRSLEIENVTVSYFRVSNHSIINIKKRDIILKLNKTVEANDTLNIQYSFTKSLSKFISKLIDAITKTNSRLIFRVRSQEATPSLELAGTKGTGFILSINNSNENNDISYHTAIRNIFSMVSNITKILLHNGVISENIWICFHQFLTTNQTLQELTVDCRLTVEHTRALSFSLNDNRTLKTLHMFNVWERKDELDGCKEIFEMLRINTALIDFTLTCHSDQLQLDFVATSLLQNKSLRVLRLPKCQIHQNTDIVLVENFLQTTSIHTLSLESIIANCEASLERLARAVDKNETLEILELEGLNCSAIFHRKKQVPDSENNVVCSSPVPISLPRSRSKFKRFLALFSCHRGEHRRHSHEEIILPPVVPIQKEDRKYVSAEPFYALCNHPSFYKQIQEITQNLKLEELQVTIGTYVKMTDVALSMRSNFTVTRLRIGRRVLKGNDIQMLVRALRDNNTITHLNLNEIKISMNNFRQIFDVLRDDRTLRVLEVSHCISHSDRDLFAQEIKTLELTKPFLKVVYENQ